MATHELKTWPEYFEPLLRGLKTVELRKDDRGYQCGDTLILREYNPTTGQYTGRSCTRTVTHVLRGGPWLADGYVALSVVDMRWMGALKRLHEVAKEWRMSLSDIAGPVKMEEGVETLMARADRNVTAFERLRDVIDELEASER